MNRGKIANLLLGLSIALLPLYTRIVAVDFTRTSKDNLMVVLFLLIGIFLGASKRTMSKFLYIGLAYSLFMVVFNQHNVLSFNVLFQTFYITSGICFFVNYYEKHDEESTDLILCGMIAGSIIQSVFIHFQYHGYEIYYWIIEFLFPGKYQLTSPGAGISNTVGSFGNNNLSASYLALTSLAWFRVKHWWWIVLPITALFLTNSMMGIGSLIAGLLYYCNNGMIKKWLIYLISIIGMIVVPFIPYNIGDSGRFAVWEKLFSMVDIWHFIFGKGPGWFADSKISVGNGEKFFQEHSAFLSVFNTFGALLLVILLPVFYKFVMTKDKNRVFSSILFVAFCNSYGHFSLSQSTVTIIIIAVAAICLAEGNKDEII